jgi:hypothetical protein
MKQLKPGDDLCLHKFQTYETLDYPVERYTRVNWTCRMCGQKAHSIDKWNVCYRCKINWFRCLFHLHKREDCRKMTRQSTGSKCK